MDPEEIAQIVKRIPIFLGFTPEQTTKMLDVCEEKRVESGDFLFREGTASSELLILLEGHLHVTTRTGAEIASIWEMGLVGEMGVLTDQPRSASVVANQPSRMLSIRRDDLLRLIEEDKDMGFKIYQNVTRLLCNRLRDNNILLEQQYLILEDLAGEG
jgi:CRP-like cAMP-binding protein